MFTNALLISTYNWPEALQICIQSANSQSILPDEIIICDDGSTDATKAVIDRLSENAPVPIKHIWQPDEGFHLARIRNKGIASTDKDYIIQVDGDIILHRDFIKDHIRFARPRHFATGSRVLLSQKVTDNLLEQQGQQNYLRQSIQNANKINGIRMPILQHLFAHYYKNGGKNKYYVKGCNMAFWREDLVRVNGYDESFVGWGLEDNDIAIRLLNADVRKRFLKFGGICYHLNHPLVSRASEEENRKRLEHVINKRIIEAAKGINQYI